MILSLASLAMMPESKGLILPDNRILSPREAMRANAATGGITVDHVDAAVPEFWANLALGALKANTVMSNLVSRDFDDTVATRGDVVNIIKRGALTVNDKTKGQQITLQTPSNDKIPVTLDKHKEVSWLIEDVASAKAVNDAVNYVQDAAIALGEQIDRDLLGLYSVLAEEVGASGEDIGVDEILAASQRLNELKCPLRGRYFVIGPKEQTSLLKTEQFTNAQWDDENVTALREATIGGKYGFTFLMDQQVLYTGASPRTYHNMAFHRDAFVLVTRPLPAPPAGHGAFSSVIEIDGIAVRVTKSYSQKDGGMLWTMDVLYGIAGMRNDTHGVEVLS